VVWKTDNGGEFKNRLIEGLTKVYGTRKEFSMSYHPQSQGQTERKNRTIIGELCRRVAQWGPQWTKYIPSLELGYNTTPHTSDGFTPHLKMFGREARMPLEVALPSANETKDWSKDAATYVREHQKQLEKVHEVKGKLHEEYMQKMAQVPRGKVQMEPFQPGDQVMRFLHLNSGNKLATKYDGPWEVLKRIDPPGQVGNSYVLSRNEEEIVRPQVDLKKYVAPKFQRPSADEETVDPTPTVETQVQEGHNLRSLEMLLAVSNLITGVRKKQSPVAETPEFHSVVPPAVGTIPFPSNSSPLQIIPASAHDRNDPRGAIPKTKGPVPPATLKAPDQVPSLVRVPPEIPSALELDRHLANLSMREGVLEQTPPDLDNVPEATESNTENRSLSDVFRITGFMPTILRLQTSGIPRPSQTNSNSGPTPSPSLTGPSTSTPKMRPTKTASAPKKGQRPYATTPTQVGILRPRLASAPETTQTSPDTNLALVTNRRTIRQLKRLQSRNNPGVAEQALDELPYARPKRVKQT